MRMKAFNERGKKMGGEKEKKHGKIWGWVGGRNKLSALFEWGSQRKLGGGDSIFVQEDI